MSLKQPLLAVGLLLSAASLTAHAALVPYTGADNVGLVYSSVSNVTWTQDANLLGSMEANPNAFGYFNRSDLINAIILANSVNGMHGLIGDTPNFFDNAGSGLYHLTTADFANNGLVTWFGAQAFVGFLNSIDYGGSNQWRLPTAGDNPQFRYNQTGSELGQLFYNELAGTAGNSIPNTSTFTNEQADAYWSGTEYAPDPDSAWGFGTDVGIQGFIYKDTQFYAWAVSPGQVNAVPVPGAVWLFGTGLLGWLGAKRRVHAG